jgi:hypothetical protein
MPQIRNIFNLGQPANLTDLVNAMGPILNRISDRLDRMEGLRGNPRFYGSTFDFPKGNLDVGQVLRAASSNQMEVSPLTLADIQGAVPNLSDLTSIDEVKEILKGFLSVYDENGTLVHEFSFSQITELSEVHGFLQSDASVWNPGGSSIGPVDDLLSGLLSVSDENNTVVHQLPFTQVVELSEIHGFLQSAPSIWNPPGGHTPVGQDLLADLLSIYDESETHIHQMPVWQVMELSEVTGFLRASPLIWNQDAGRFALGYAVNAGATPSVANLNTLYVANSSPQTITNFLGGVIGQTVIVQIHDDVTTIGFAGSSNLFGNGYGGVGGMQDYLCNAGDFLIITCTAGTPAAPVWSVLVCNLKIVQQPLLAATSVVHEQTPGQAPATGTSLAYARGDHTHGTPP